MINEKQFFNSELEEPCREYDHSFDTRLSRLQSTLFGNLKLVNMFKRLIDKNYIPLTLKNIDVNIDSESEIENFLLKSSLWVEHKLSKEIENWVIDNGSEWQKSRL